MKKQKPFVSVVIPVRTVTNHLRESIPYLKSLDYDRFEILIFTDEKETLPDADYRFRAIASGKVGPAQKRNLALSFAKGDILAFLDDDAFPVKEWLSKAVECFDDPEICALGGPEVTPLNEGFMETLSGDVLESFLTSGDAIHRHLPKERRFVDDYPSVNLFVRADDFRRVGGFDVEFWPGEDTKLCLDLLKKSGKKILYDPSVLVYHHRRALFSPHLKQVSRYGMHRGQFARIFPENSRKPQYFVPSLFVLGLLFGPLLAILNRLFLLPYLFFCYLYLALLFYESFKVIMKRKSLVAGLFFLIGVFLTHLFYGSAFLYGLFVRPKLNLRTVDTSSNRYLGG